MKKNITAVFLILVLMTFALVLIFRPAADGESPAVPASGEAALATAPPLTDADRAEALLDDMSLSEKVWQMLFVFPQDIMDEYTCTDLEAWADAMLSCPAGGFVISGTNMQSEAQLRAMLSCISGAGDIAPFIGIDEEGGQVARLSYTLGVTTDFKPMYTYREGGEGTAYKNAETIASELADFGFNLDFAPVADVWTNPKNTVIGKRAYSDDPREAAQLVAAAVKGFSDGGVISTLKHFPGHGDTEADSHYAPAYSDKTLDELRGCEFLPFASGIEAGAGMVMVGHITLTQVDADVPSTLSEKVITGLLRGELGFDGVVITDSFSMSAIADNYDENEAAVRCINAGCDIILGASDPQSVAAAIMENVDEARIDESVLRILELKSKSGLTDFDFLVK